MAATAGRYGWFAKSYKRSQASIRLRLLEPMAALQRRGVDIDRYDTHAADSYDAVIFSKSFTPAAMAAVRRAEAAGQAVVVDVCDNLFDPGSRNADNVLRADVVEQLSRAAIVTVPTPGLGAQLCAEIPALAGKIRIVPDTLEDMTPGPTSWIDRFKLHCLRRFLGRYPDALHCVWFGNSSGNAAGIAHLHRAVVALESFDRPVTLTIITDSWPRYRRAARHWRVPSHYLSWSLGSFAAALRDHRVALLPVERNGYTAGKSINRPATAIMAGLGVIADAIDSYEELRPFIVLDDWQGGFARYADAWDEEQPRLAQGRAHIEHRYGVDVVAARWEALLSEISAR